MANNNEDKRPKQSYTFATPNQYGFDMLQPNTRQGNGQSGMVMTGGPNQPTKIVYDPTWEGHMNPYEQKKQSLPQNGLRQAQSVESELNPGGSNPYSPQEATKLLPDFFKFIAQSGQLPGIGMNPMNKGGYLNPDITPEAHQQRQVDAGANIDAVWARNEADRTRAAQGRQQVQQQRQDHDQRFMQDMARRDPNYLEANRDLYAQRFGIDARQSQTPGFDGPDNEPDSDSDDGGGGTPKPAPQQQTPYNAPANNSSIFPQSAPPAPANATDWRTLEGRRRNGEEIPYQGNMIDQMLQQIAPIGWENYPKPEGSEIGPMHGPAEKGGLGLNIINKHLTSALGWDGKSVQNGMVVNDEAQGQPQQNPMQQLDQWLAKMLGWGDKSINNGVVTQSGQNPYSR
jgi:hypothetical protein